MNIETPQMYARTLLPSGYEDNIVSGYLSMRGSGASLQDDFGSGLWAPTGFSRASGKTYTQTGTGDATVVAHTSGVNPTIPADSDIICMVTGIIAPSATALFFGWGSANPSTSTGGCVNRYSGANGCFFGVAAGTAYGIPTTNSATLTAGNTVTMVAVLDVSDSSGTADGVTSYLYDHTAGAVLDDAKGSHSVASATLTPEASMRSTGFSTVYGAAMFSFPSNGLPASATWRADMVQLGANLIAAKA